jgi:hypothetical protein
MVSASNPKALHRLKESFSSGLWVFAQSEEKFGGYNRAFSVREQLEAVASVPGLKGIEFISPLHVSLENATEVKGWLEELDLEAVSINPYLWTEPQWRLGALTAPDPRVRRAAIVSGVAIAKYKTLAFVLCAALAGLSGVLLSARMAGGSARMADGFQMRAIAVVILGGTAISGGVDGPLRTFVGVLIVMVLDTGMNMVGVNPWFQQAIYGAILIGAVALTIDRNRMSIIK